VDPRAGVDNLEKRKFLTLPGLELDPSVVQPVASRYTDCTIPAREHYLEELSKITHKEISIVGDLANISNRTTCVG
jgi:hypothetical protein